eukprot:m.147916 g.147916  ORF g.147916 m.147916 type:complete len:84 (-) comp13246_c1_seq2:2410-2661(-)
MFMLPLYVCVIPFNLNTTYKGLHGDTAKHTKHYHDTADRIGRMHLRMDERLKVLKSEHDEMMKRSKMGAEKLRRRRERDSGSL